MYSELILVILLGVMCGVFSGLVPGIHVNLISLLLVSSSAFFLNFFSLEALVVFIVAMAITHTFLDTIPSIFLGAPEGATALSVLPGHRMLLEGNGLEAVKLTLIGSLSGLLFSTITYLFLEKVIQIIYPIIKNYIGHLLFIAALFIILKSKNTLKTMMIFIFSGALGLMVLNSRIENPLFPLLTGFFGLSTLIFSLTQKSTVPKQNKSKKTSFEIKKGIFATFLGTVSGFITAFLPGLGASTAAAISSSIKKSSDTKDFLIMIGAISTVNFFMSIAALNVLGKARNGAILAVLDLMQKPSTLMLIFASLVSGGIAVLIALKISKIFLKFLERVNYELVLKIVIFSLILITFILSGFRGWFVLFNATAIGLYANRFNISRNSMMACIIVPVMTYFLL